MHNVCRAAMRLRAGMPRVSDPRVVGSHRRAGSRRLRSVVLRQQSARGQGCAAFSESDASPPLGTPGWYEGSYGSYIGDLKKRKGADADQPHRIAYKKLVRA